MRRTHALGRGQGAVLGIALGACATAPEPVAAPPSAPPSVPAQPSSVADPVEITVTSLPAGSVPLLSEELAVWRSRAELPATLAAHIPADFDFDAFALAGPASPSHIGPVLLTAASAASSEGVLLLDVRLSTDCPVCRGIHQPPPTPPSASVRLLRLWKVPASTRTVLLREIVESCPPCFAP